MLSIKLNSSLVLHVLILSSWSSGSTFLSKLISHYPGVFLMFEPLVLISSKGIHLGGVTCERPETFILLSSLWSGAIEAGQVNDSRQLLKDIFNCNYEAGSGGSKLLWFLKTDLYADWVLHNDFLRTACMKDPWLCYSPDFVSASCQAHPIRLIKTVRMRLYQVHQLLRDPG